MASLKPCCRGTSRCEIRDDSHRAQRARPCGSRLPGRGALGRLLPRRAGRARAPAAGDLPGRARRIDPLPALSGRRERLTRFAGCVRTRGAAAVRVVRAGLPPPAFAVSERSDVELAHDSAVVAGAEILHTPREWPDYHPSYYAT